MCAILALLLGYSSNNHIAYHFIVYGLVDLGVSPGKCSHCHRSDYSIFMGEGCSPDRVLVQQTEIPWAPFPDPSPQPGVVSISVISTFGRWTGEDQEFKVILGFIASLRLAWATRDLEGKLTLLLFPLSPEL